MRSRIAVTLVEMLTVLAILVVLASLAGTLFSRLQQHSKQQATRNLLLVLDGALSEYRDSEGMFPVPPATATGPAARVQFLLQILESVAASRQVLDHIDKGLIKDRWPLPQDGGPDGQVEIYDPWDMALDYTFGPSDSIPALRSAGPDRVYGTADDITNR